jgi:hypothetical protein
VENSNSSHEDRVSHRNSKNIGTFLKNTNIRSLRLSGKKTEEEEEEEEEVTRNSDPKL